MDKDTITNVKDQLSISHLTYLKISKTNKDWDELTVAQQQGILQAIESIKNGKGIKHEVIMEKYRHIYAENESAKTLL